MPLDFGDHPARLGPASGLISEIGVEPPHMVRGSPDRSVEEVADPVLQDAVCRNADRVFDPFAFEELVDIGIGKAGVGPEVEARDLALVSRHDRLQDAFPPIGTVNVAGTKCAAFQIAELVEHEEGMVAVHS